MSDQSAGGIAREPIARPSRLLRAERPLWLGVLLAIVFGLVGAPLLGTLFGAVTDTPPGVAPHLSAAALRYAYDNANHLQSLANSLTFAALVSTLVLVLGGSLAWAAARTDSSLHRFAGLFVLVPIFIPAVLFVAGWMLLLGPRNGLLNMMFTEYLGFERGPFNVYSFAGMVWIGTLQELPLAFLWLWPAFRSMNPDLEEAGFISGANARTVLFRISLPILRPALLSAWIIFFIYALGALIVPLMVGLPSRIIFYSTEIYLAAQRVPSDLNLASAYSLLFLIAAGIGVAAYRRFTGDTERFATVSGKAYNPRLIKLGRWGALVTTAGFLVLFLSAGLPLLVVAWNAFLPLPQAPSVAALKLLSFKNFSEALSYGPAIHALLNSLWLGAAAGVVSTLLGALIAWCTLRLNTPRYGLALLDQIATMPIAMPGMIVGVSLLWFYLMIPLPIYGTSLILLIAYVTLHLPYAVRICAAGLSQIHRELEEAGRVSGAGLRVVLSRIVFRLMLPSLMASVLYVALRSFREYAASIFLAGPGNEVFSVLVLDMWDGGHFNVLSAYVTMVTVVLAATVGLLSLVFRRFGMPAVIH
jgi:iron(III) transport system permease protein